MWIVSICRVVLETERMLHKKMWPNLSKQKNIRGTFKTVSLHKRIRHNTKMREKAREEENLSEQAIERTHMEEALPAEKLSKYFV